MRHPYQSVLYGRDSTDTISEGFLIAACGPRLVTLSLTSNEIISEWSANDAPLAPTTQNDQGEILQEMEGERPVKKQKISNGTAKKAKAPNVIKLAASPDYQHIVAVTEDKCVRVFECQEGRLEELSQRSMPKRPCAIQVMPDNATILIGDKFGDVYSLPLIPATVEDVEEQAKPDATPQSTEGARVAANELTVHSKRNRIALEMQLKQKNFTPRKEPLQFDHKLLLGHVSMLTDMRYVTNEVDGQSRGYIITADRDEHIRISRGPPQAHIIEGFCFGHTQFVSRICQIGSSDVLVSGGGDDWIGVWKWPEFKLLQKVSLKELVMSAAGPDFIEDDYKLAISGIWSASLESGDESTDVIAIGVEKVTALFLIPSSVLSSTPADGTLAGSAAVAKQLPGVPLDVTALRGELLVSLDLRGDQELRLGMIGVSVDSNNAVKTTEWSDVGTKDASSILRALNEYATHEEVTEKELDDLLYGVANLRKRGPLEGEDTQEGAAEEG